MSVRSGLDALGGAVLFIVSLIELRNGILMLWQDRPPILLTARLGPLCLNVLPEPIRRAQHARALEVYARRRKIYGTFAIIGALWGILVAYLVARNF